MSVIQLRAALENLCAPRRASHNFGNECLRPFVHALRNVPHGEKLLKDRGGFVAGSTQSGTPYAIAFKRGKKHAKRLIQVRGTSTPADRPVFELVATRLGQVFAAEMVQIRQNIEIVLRQELPTKRMREAFNIWWKQANDIANEGLVKKSDPCWYLLNIMGENEPGLAGALFNSKMGRIHMDELQKAARMIVEELESNPAPAIDGTTRRKKTAGRKPNAERDEAILKAVESGLHSSYQQVGMRFDGISRSAVGHAVKRAKERRNSVE